MNWWRRLWGRSQMEDQLDKELRFHLEQHTLELEARGHTPHEARRLAQLSLGGTEQVKEECRDVRGTRWLTDLIQDFRHAGRRLRAHPGFAAVAALTLALGIGASTAIFSAVYPILFAPLPYPQPSRIMMVWDIYQGSRTEVTFHTYRELAARNHSFETLAVMEPWQPTMTGEAEPERFEGQSVSANYFRVLGLPPALGRDFQASDERFHGPKVVILSDRLWRRRFGADHAVVGREITLDDDLYTVLGVMPREFENVLAASAEIWTPAQYDPQHITTLDTSEWGHHLRMAARLRPGVSLDQARRDSDSMAQNPVPDFPRAPWASLKNGFIIDSLQDGVTRGVRPALLAVLGAVMLVLAIACFNVTNLLLARGAERRGEFAMRIALGAGRARMIRQLLTESLLLAALAGALGIAIAEVGVDALAALSPPELPRVGAIAVRGVAFAFALALTTLTGLLVGLIPALHAFRSDLHTSLRQNSRSTAGPHPWTRRALVVVEVALALVLLVSSGLLLRSLERLFAVDPGFDPSHVLTMQVQTAGHRFDDLRAGPGVGLRNRRRFFAQALDAVRQVSGVQSAAFTGLLPLSDDSQFGKYGTLFETGGNYDVFRYVTTPGYWRTLGVPLLRGRLLDERDAEGAPPAVLISESLARREFPGQDPIGKRVHVGPVDRPWYIIVGVVGDVRQASLAETQPDAVYITPEQSWFADEAMSVVVRARGDAAALVPLVRNAIWSVDKDQPIVRVATMGDLLRETAAQRRFALILFEIFGLVALALAATGIYGVLSGSVNERKREIGVRSALGASRRSILALVLRQGMAMTALGMAIGLSGTAVATQAIATLLFGVSRLDPITYAGVVTLLVAVAGVACWVPAWRASRVDPAITLRVE